ALVAILATRSVPTASGQRRREVGAEEIRPHDQPEHAPPEAELQVADGEQPAGEPERADRRMLNDVDPALHVRRSPLRSAISPDARGPTLTVVNPATALWSLGIGEVPADQRQYLRRQHAGQVVAVADHHRSVVLGVGLA